MLEELRRRPEPATLRTFVREASDEIAAQAEATQPEASPTRPPVPGDLVEVAGRGIRGELVEIAGERARIQRGGLRFEVPSGQLRLVGDAPARERVAIEVDRPADAPAEINLIGQRVRDATDALAAFLDRAVRAGLSEVRVVHGIGRSGAHPARRPPLRGPVGPAPPGGRRPGARARRDRGRPPRRRARRDQPDRPAGARRDRRARRLPRSRRAGRALRGARRARDRERGAPARRARVPGELAVLRWVPRVGTGGGWGGRDDRGAGLRASRRESRGAATSDGCRSCIGDAPRGGSYLFGWANERMGRARVNFPDLKAPPTWRCGQRRPPAKPASLRAPDLNSAYPRSRRNQTQDWEPAPPKPLKSALPESRSAGCIGRRRRPNSRHPRMPDRPARCYQAEFPPPQRPQRRW